ncbi:MAG: hypothetical protein KDI71_10605 [Xanthomonadales bacterium]|nr:hypothetical protein [Xanthomonadales bacterium]
MPSKFLAQISVAIGLAALSGSLYAIKPDPNDPANRGTFRFAAPAVKFDISPPLRTIQAIPPPGTPAEPFWGSLMADPDGPKIQGPQSVDRSVQGFLGPMTVPPPLQTFAAGTGGANPPDPNGDIGPNHYVRMSNVSFQIFDRSGTSVFGPAAINTLFSGFGGDCEAENAGDPVVLYDQLADRWLLTQFSDSNGPGFFNCVALSQTSDPTGSYFRWAFPTGTFPDYPKYGVWPNAYLISTREVNAGLIGAYAIDRQQMLAGVPNPTVVSFTVPVNENSGDGLLPSDLDGNLLPPDPDKSFYIGAMDDGGPYGATQDALAIWEFDVDFATPTNSTFILTDVLPISPYDTQFPCSGRRCIPQPTQPAVDILSYRQRAINRAAYRNFGSYQSLVTNQSVEAAPGIGGTRWWEIRNLGNSPVLYQDSTFAPGVTDQISRWMGSAAQDAAGNIALGYSAAGTPLAPAIRYTGRLQGDPLNQMRGEGVIINGAGENTGSGRWGDYTSLNIDPTDDCTFWYINEYFATTGGTWTLRVGSFRFPECGVPGGSFGIAAVPLTQSVCAPNDAVYTVDAHAYEGFTGSAMLSATNPAGTTATFAPPTIASIPGSSTLTIGNTGGAAFGQYQIDIQATSGATQTRSVMLNLFTATPSAPALVSPAPAAVGQSRNPTLEWMTVTQGETYVVEIATDNAFANIVETSPATTGTSYVVQNPLNFGTEYFWRVVSTNICGAGTASATGSFTTRPAVGVCTGEDSARREFFDNVDNGNIGWAIAPASGNNWRISTANPSSAPNSWLGPDFTVTADTTLASPIISIPADSQFSALRFQHSVNMEENGANACWDGGFVEISTDNGGSWAPLDPVTPLEGSYFGPIPGGQQAYCGTVPYSTASMDLAGFAGQDVRVRFRVITDSNTGDFPLGWDVDDIQVISCGLNKDGFE